MLEFHNVVFQYDSEDFNIIDGLSFHYFYNMPPKHIIVMIN